MCRPLWCAFVVILGAQPAARALELPLHPTEAEVIKAIAATEQLDVEPVEIPHLTRVGFSRLAKFDSLTPQEKANTRKAEEAAKATPESHGYRFPVLENGALSNLYVSVLKQFGFEDQSFGTSTGTLKGLQIA